MIITGATGFIGTWLIKEMISNSVQVTAIVRDKNRISPEISSKITVIQTDSYYNVELEDGDFDVFYHLAWGGVSSTYKNNLDIQLSNIKISVEALELANKLRCKKFIAAGTVAEYTMCDNIMNYSQRQTPSDLYGAAKTSSYFFLEVLARQLQIPFIWALLPSTFGEGRNDNNIIIYTIRELLAGKKPKFGELDQMWDFLYVSEVTRALWLIGEKGMANKIYGIGSGQFLRLKDYIIKIRDMINPDLELGINEISGNGNSKVISSCVGTYDLAKDTGFRVETNFEEGIRKTIDYYKRKI